MTLSDGVATTLISVVSALLIVVLKDIILAPLQRRQAGRRSLILARIKHAYSPLEFFTYQLFRTDDPVQKTILLEKIGDILCQHGHLLSPRTTAAFYTLLEDENAGAYLLKSHFKKEVNQLKEDFYRKWYSHRLTFAHQDVDPRNDNDDRSVEALTASQVWR